jgi:hypothetical protein
MSALINSPAPASPAVVGPSGNHDEAVRRLRSEMAPVRLQFTWFGLNKALNPEQKARAAATFEADAPFVSAGKKLWDTRTPAFRAVSAVRTKIIESWRGMSLPFPEPGVRLLRRDQVEMFLSLMTDYRVELADAVAELDRHYGDLRASAARQLGDLYDPNDYPPSLTGLFDVSWDFPNVEPPGYLLALSPGLYREEQRRVRQRFDEAVRLAEEAFLAEFARLVGHLTERLGTEADGTPRVFRDSAVGNLSAFFERFRQLDVRSHEQLDALVTEAQRIVRGIGPQDLRDQRDLRQHVAERLGRVRDELETLVIDRPRRRVLRGPSPASPSPSSET